jgi:hypothetical protein
VQHSNPVKKTSLFILCLESSRADSLIYKITATDSIIPFPGYRYGHTSRSCFLFENFTAD